jgi:predicted transcriptional regulator
LRKFQITVGKNLSVLLASVLVFSLLSYNRSELEIICDVLGLCLNGANRRKIICEAALNTSAFNKYLAKLLNPGFLTVRVTYVAGKHPDVKVVFETTKSGVHFLKTCMDTLNMLGSVRKSQTTVKPMEKTPTRV